MERFLFALMKASFYGAIILLGFIGFVFWKFFVLNPFWCVLWVAAVVFMFTFIVTLIDSDEQLIKDNHLSAKSKLIAKKKQKVEENLLVNIYPH